MSNQSIILSQTHNSFPDNLIVNFHRQNNELKIITNNNNNNNNNNIYPSFKDSFKDVIDDVEQFDNTNKEGTEIRYTIEPAESQYTGGGAENNNSTTTWILVCFLFVFLAALIGLAIACYRRRLKKSIYTPVKCPSIILELGLEQYRKNQSEKSKYHVRNQSDKSICHNHVRNQISNPLPSIYESLIDDVLGLEPNTGSNNPAMITINNRFENLGGVVNNKCQKSLSIESELFKAASNDNRKIKEVKVLNDDILCGDQTRDTCLYNKIKKDSKIINTNERDYYNDSAHFLNDSDAFGSINNMSKMNNPSNNSHSRSMPSLKHLSAHEEALSYLMVNLPQNQIYMNKNDLNYNKTLGSSKNRTLFNNGSFIRSRSFNEKIVFSVSGNTAQRLNELNAANKMRNSLSKLNRCSINLNNRNIFNNINKKTVNITKLRRFHLVSPIRFRALITQKMAKISMNKNKTELSKNNSKISKTCFKEKFKLVKTHNSCFHDTLLNNNVEKSHENDSSVNAKIGVIHTLKNSIWLKVQNANSYFKNQNRIHNPKIQILNNSIEAYTLNNNIIENSLKNSYFKNKNRIHNPKIHILNNSIEAYTLNNCIIENSLKKINSKLQSNSDNDNDLFSSLTKDTKYNEKLEETCSDTCYLSGFEMPVITPLKYFTKESQIFECSFKTNKDFEFKNSNNLNYLECIDYLDEVGNKNSKTKLDVNIKDDKKCEDITQEELLLNCRNNFKYNRCNSRNSFSANNLDNITLNSQKKNIDNRKKYSTSTLNFMKNNNKDIIRSGNKCMRVYETNSYFFQSPITIDKSEEYSINKDKSLLYIISDKVNSKTKETIEGGVTNKLDLPSSISGIKSETQNYLEKEISNETTDFKIKASIDCIVKKKLSSSQGNLENKSPKEKKLYSPSHDNLNNFNEINFNNEKTINYSTKVYAKSNDSNINSIKSNKLYNEAPNILNDSQFSMNYLLKIKNFDCVF